MDHVEAFSTWSYETDEAISLVSLREMVKRELPGDIYRCKGVVYTSDQPGRRAILQCVGRRTDVTLAGPWGDRQPKTQIVAIGAAGMKSQMELNALFDGCITRRQEEVVETSQGVHTVRI